MTTGLKVCIGIGIAIAIGAGCYFVFKPGKGTPSSGSGSGKVTASDFDEMVAFFAAHNVDVFTGASATIMQNAKSKFLQNFSKADLADIKALVARTESSWTPAEKLRVGMYLQKIK